MADTANVRRAKRRLSRPTGRAMWIRTVAVAVFDALAVLALASLAATGAWAVATMVALAGALVNWAYLNPRANASRWLTPGLILMAFFVVYPVLYTAYVSVTNWQTGNLLTKAQVIDQLEARRLTDGEDDVPATLAVYRDGADRLALLVTAEGIDPFLGTPAAGDGGDADPEAPADGATPAADLTGIDIDPDDPPAEIGEYRLLSQLQASGEAGRLEGAELVLPDGRVARVETLGSARISAAGRRFSYDPASDTLFDAETKLTCTSGEGTFYCNGVPEGDVASAARLASDNAISCSNGVCDDVPLYALDSTLAGWREVVGLDNYADLATDARIRTPFVRVLAWNVFFAFASVLMTFALGLGLATVVQNESMRGRNIYRSIYIIPYAMPAFLSILVWRGLLNSQFGKVNGVLGTFGLPAIDWLGTTSGAMAAVLLVNLWLGFPYMFLIASGALTSIPEELLEAARVDGAGPWRSFRTVTLPLLLVSTAPLLIGSFAFNFNNFVLIYLLTAGGPPLVGYDVPVGATDLLISFTFDLAQASGRGSQYSLASAVVVVIFAVLATTSALSFRLTKRLEEIYDQ